MDDLIKEFLAESREGLDRMDLCLTALEERPGDKKLLGEIFRAVHTIKGATGFLGYPRLERLTHSGETLLSLLRDGLHRADPMIIDALFQLMDRLREVLTLIERTGREGDRSSDDDSTILLTLERLHQTETEPIHAEERAPSPTPVGAGCGLESAVEEGGQSSPSPAHASAHEAPVAADTAPERVLPAGFGTASVAGAAGMLPALRSETETSRDSESTVRVDVQVLDHMVHLVGELVLARNQLLQQHGGETSAADAAERLDTVTQELRQTVMQARMLPLAQLFQRFPRMARDLAKLCSKSVRIEFSGQETALDRSLIEAIKDPLAHTLRNAIDHGIEAASERLAAGKSAEGLVQLRARQQSGWVVIEITDDGAGISKERLIARGIEKGRITPEQAARMSRREVMELVFEPGFSTATQVTNVSGRGVGMDVVRSQVERVGGSVEVESECGTGTTVRLRVPLTLAIVPAWVVRVGEHSFCIPQNALAEVACVHYRDATLFCSRIHSADVYRLREELLPMVALDDVLSLTRKRGPLGFYVAVVSVDDVRFALVVDDVIAAEDIVIKPVSTVVRDLGVYSGATVLGDGVVAMVLDMPAIATRAGMRNRKPGIRVDTPAVHPPDPVVLLAEIETPDGTVQRVAFPIESVERIERIAATDFQKIEGHLMIPYRGAALIVEDPAFLFERAAGDAEATVLIRSGVDCGRRGLLVSRVLEVTKSGAAESDSRLHGIPVALLKDRLTLMSAAMVAVGSQSKQLREVA